MELFWIDSSPVGRIATATRPRGNEWLDDDLAALVAAGTTLLVSMLTPSENAELGLVDEARAARRVGLSFVNVPIEDRGLPDRATAFLDGVERAASTLRAGGAVVVHCRMGIGRSSMFAAASLVRLGVDPDTAWASIEKVRGRRVPDVDAQREWIARMRDVLRRDR